MQYPSSIQLDLDKVIVTLFCCYALSMPFELILEILYGVDTIFKPFRICSIAIIGVFVIKVITQGLYVDQRDRVDWWLYGVFIYGGIISCFKIITGVFNMKLFINDAFQFSLHVATFFVYKSVPISKEQAFRIFRWFIIGVFINAIYITYLFIGIKSGREAGFTDNPNYAAFGLVAASVYLILQLNFPQKSMIRFWKILLILFLLYTFGIEASRTGFLMLVIAGFLIFLFIDWAGKIKLVSVVVLLSFVLLSRQSTNLAFDGPLVLLERISTKIESGETDVRFVVWRGVFRVLESEGYEGLGIGQFKANFPRYFSEESDPLILAMTQYGYFLSTHNDYLAIITDYGLPSLIFYFVFLGVTFLRLLRQTNYHRADRATDFLTQFCFILFTCIIFYGLTAENFQHQLYWFLLMFTTKHYHNFHISKKY
ncbi:MAG: O-antigen ligase family protein [Bacteroidota bacterium]